MLNRRITHTIMVLLKVYLRHRGPQLKLYVKVRPQKIFRMHIYATIASIRDQNITLVQHALVVTWIHQEHARR